MAYGSDPIVGGSGSGYGKDPAQSGSGQSQPPDQIREGINNFLQGLSAGVTGDVVGAGQIAGSVLPKAITDPIANSTLGRRLTEMSNQTPKGFAGGAGNIIGAGLPFMLQPELGVGRLIEAAPYIGRVAPKVLKQLWDVIRTSTIPAAVQPAESQKERLKNMAIGTGVGGATHLAGQGAGSVLQKWAAQRAANQAAQVQREAAQARAERVGNLNERIGASNERYRTRYDRERAARDQQTLQHQQAVQTAKQAKDAVPEHTTRNWWREALTPIGEQGRAPTAVTPEASAQVRKIIGDRLNNVRQQMLLNPNDANFQSEMEHIRGEIESRLSNQGMRDQWSFRPESKFDKDGNLLPPTKGDLAQQRNSVWSKYVEQPLENLQYMSGQQFSDYVSRLGDLAEQYGRRAMSAPQSERPELEMISRGLRHAIDAIEQHGTGGDAALTKQLVDAKRAYNLWSIGNGATAAEKGGVMTPGGIAREWARRQGDAAYGAEMIPGHPQFHPENARIKQGLERARQAHEATPPPPAPQAPLRAPATRQKIPVPKVPPAPTEDQRLPGVVSHLVGHGVTALTGSPTAGRVARGVTHYGGRGVARPVLGATKALGEVTPGIAVGATRIPEIVVHAKRPKPEEQQ